VIEINLTLEERAALNKSAAAVKELVDVLLIDLCLACKYFVI